MFLEHMEGYVIKVRHKKYRFVKIVIWSMGGGLECKRYYYEQI